MQLSCLTDSVNLACSLFCIYCSSSCFSSYSLIKLVMFAATIDLPHRLWLISIMRYQASSQHKKSSSSTYPSNFARTKSEFLTLLPLKKFPIEVKRPFLFCCQTFSISLSSKSSALSNTSPRLSQLVSLRKFFFCIGVLTMSIISLKSSNSRTLGYKILSKVRVNL